MGCSSWQPGLILCKGLIGQRDGYWNFLTFIQRMALRMARIATHVADARTCCLHPANATHRQMNDAELEACGISPDMVRLSCGLEATDDLIADVAQALDTI